MREVRGGYWEGERGGRDVVPTECREGNRREKVCNNYSLARAEEGRERGKLEIVEKRTEKREGRGKGKVNDIRM